MISNDHLSPKISSDALKGQSDLFSIFFILLKGLFWEPWEKLVGAADVFSISGETFYDGAL
jgi:hypothetical protein